MRDRHLGVGGSVTWQCRTRRGGPRLETTPTAGLAHGCSQEAILKADAKIDAVAKRIFARLEIRAFEQLLKHR